MRVAHNHSPRKNAFIFTVILLTIISGSANNILFKKVRQECQSVVARRAMSCLTRVRQISIPFENYPFFLVLYSSVFSVPIYWVLIIPLLVVPRSARTPSRSCEFNFLMLPSCCCASLKSLCAVLPSLGFLQCSPISHTHVLTV